MKKRMLCLVVLAVLVSVTVEAQAARRLFRRRSCPNGGCTVSTAATNSAAPTATSAPPAPEAPVAQEAAPAEADEQVATQTATRSRRGIFRRRR